MTDYCTLEQLKARLDLDDTDDDAILEAAITATSRAIELITARRFSSNAETRYYQARNSYEFMVDDLLSVTTLQTDNDGDGSYEYSWASSDYVLMPVNAAADNAPYRWIERDPNSLLWFPVTRHHPKAIKLAGGFGYSATTPGAVKEAALLLGAQVFQRKDAIFGVSGGSGFIQRVKEAAMRDPHINMLLAPYVRIT